MITSWGNLPRIKNVSILNLNWRDQVVPFADSAKSFLAYGKGRSYGDSCLNENGVVIVTNRLNRFISFDQQKGILSCESGITFKEILELIVPYGWFLPVVPGTQFVTLGGAIANDIHGKNHHHAGTFGRHVLHLELLRSDGQRLMCSPTENFVLYAATIGGLGLTGLILSATIQLMRIPSGFLEVETVKFNNLEEFFSLSTKSEQNYEYSVAWLDCLASEKNFGRGIFIRANHAPNSVTENYVFRQQNPKFNIPFFMPKFILNNISIKLFNHLYFHKHSINKPAIISYDKFFFPLDAITHWNKIYGKRGFFQYQLVIPEENRAQVFNILREIVSSRLGSFLSVLKTFGDIGSPGMLSFPKKGITLALDFPNHKEKTKALFDRLDQILVSYGGRIYPAKDARMSASMFKLGYPNWQSFADYVDPKFSSNFWRRVTNDKK